LDASGEHLSGFLMRGAREMPRAKGIRKYVTVVEILKESPNFTAIERINSVLVDKYGEGRFTLPSLIWDLNNYSEEFNAIPIRSEEDKRKVLGYKMTDKTLEESAKAKKANETKPVVKKPQSKPAASSSEKSAPVCNYAIDPDFDSLDSYPPLSGYTFN
jgi:hypothetical protein